MSWDCSLSSTAVALIEMKFNVDMYTDCHVYMHAP